MLPPTPKPRASKRMSTAPDDLDDLVPGSTLTRRDLRAVNDELILRQRQAEATEYVRNRGRKQSPKTRQLISAKLAAHRKREALAADYISPLRQARFDKGLTQSGLAAAALVDQTVIQRLETSKGAPPSRLTLARLARTLRCTPDALA